MEASGLKLVFDDCIVITKDTTAYEALSPLQGYQIKDAAYSFKHATIYPVKTFRERLKVAYQVICWLFRGST